MQTAVDTQHHLIVAHEVTNVGSDRHQLKHMSESAREALATAELTVLADRVKAWMGATHFLCRGLAQVSAEMSLQVLAYNLKRVMKILGTGHLAAAPRA